MSKEVTAAQIESWKQKHGDVFAYKVDGKKCYLKRPDRKTISAASMVGKEDPFRFSEIILANCWLGGDDELRTEDKYFMGLTQQINDIIEIKIGTLKKL